MLNVIDRTVEGRELVKDFPALAAWARRVDDAAPPEVREEASGAITWDQALRHDPDLDAVGKGMARPRAKFSSKLLGLLTDNEVFVRQLADTMLKGLWPGVRDPDITTCNPRKMASCTAAKNAWAKFLNK